MKKLLSLLTITTLTSSAAINVVSCSSKSSSLTKKTLTSDELNATQSLAKSLILRNVDNIDATSTMTDNTQNDAELVKNLNSVFDVSDYTSDDSISSIISSSSKIKYQEADSDSTTYTSGDMSLSSMQSMLQQVVPAMLSNFDNVQDVISLITSLLSVTLTTSVGGLLAPILSGDDKNDIISKILYAIQYKSTWSDIETALKDVNGIKPDGSDSKYAGLTYVNIIKEDSNDGPEKDGSVTHTLSYTLDPDSVMGIVMGNFKTSLPKLISGTETNDDIINIIETALMLINYMSQFSVATVDNTTITDNDIDNSLIDTHLFGDAKTTNDEYKEKINNSKFAKVNMANISSLFKNIAKFNSNNGLGIQQLLFIMFGYSKTTLKSVDSYTDDSGSISYGNTAVGNTYSATDPMGIFLTSILNDISIGGSTGMIGTVLVPTISELLNNLSQGETFDNAIAGLGTLINLLGIVGISLTEEQGKAIADALNTIIKNWCPTLLSEENGTEITWTKDNDGKYSLSGVPPTPTNNNGKNIYISNPAVENGSFQDLWSGTGNQSLLKPIFKLLNVMGISLPDSIKDKENIKDLIGDTSQKYDIIDGISLSIDDVINLLTQKDGILDLLFSQSNALSDVAELAGKLTGKLTDSDAINNARILYHDNVSLEAADEPAIKAIDDATYETGNETVLTYAAKFAIAVSKEEVNSNFVDVDGNPLNSADEVEEAILSPINDVINRHFVGIKSFVNSLLSIVTNLIGDSIDNIKTTIEDKEEQFTFGSVTNKDGEYDYTATYSGKTYNISLIKDADDDYYKMSIS